MNKTLIYPILIFLISVGFNVQAQEVEAPNYKKIEKNISKEKSPLYYPRIMERFLAGDSTMSQTEKAHLYFGYTFHDDYAPYSVSDHRDSLKSILDLEEHSEKDLQNILGVTEAMLEDFPFDTRALHWRMYAFKELGDSEAYAKCLARFKVIFDAILNSGDGLEKKSAYHVIVVSHEYDVLNILGFDFGGKQSLIEHYDHLEVADNQYGIDGFYFDISPCLNSLSKMFTK